MNNTQTQWTTVHNRRPPKPCGKQQHKTPPKRQIILPISTYQKVVNIYNELSTSSEQISEVRKAQQWLELNFQSNEITIDEQILEDDFFDKFL